MQPRSVVNATYYLNGRQVQQKARSFRQKRFCKYLQSVKKVKKKRPGSATITSHSQSLTSRGRGKRHKHITKTYLYNFDPLKPHFCIVKLGFTGVYIIFLISAQNIDCGYSLEPPRRGGSNEYPQSMFCAEI